MDIGNWITLFAVIVALGIGVASILHTQRLQTKERKERLLNEIIEWAIKVRKFINSIDTGGFNSELERSQAKGEYSTLKFTGKSIIVSVKKETLGNTILEHLKETIKFFNDISWNSLQGSEKKETRETYNKACENVIIEANTIKTKI